MINIIRDLLLSFHLMLLLGELLFCVGVKRRKFFALRIIPSATLYLSFPFLLPNRWYNGFFMIGSWFSWLFLFIFAMSLLIIFFCFEIKISEVLFIGLGAYAAENMLSNLRTCIYTVLRLMEFPTRGLPMFVIYMIIATLFYTLYYLLLVKGYRSLSDFYSNYISKTILIIFCVIVLFITYLLSWWSSQNGLINISVNIYAVICDLLLIVAQFGLFYGGKVSVDKVIAEHMLAAIAEQKKMSEENINCINIKCHDLKRQIELMRKTGENEEKKKLIDELDDMVMIYDSEFHTGNNALDVLLTEKSLYCNKNGIKISCMIDGVKLSFMESNDIYAMFGNMLDNAIESVMKSEKVNRVICFYVGLHGETLVIHMDNYCENPPEFSDGVPITTKSEKNYHGFGTKSILYVTKKYGGNVVMYAEDKRFCLDIIVPYTEKHTTVEQKNAL